MNNNNNELTHWGVKGMKWGVRRTSTRNVYRKGKKILSKGDDVGNTRFGSSRTHIGRISKASKSKQQPTVEERLAKMERKEKARRVRKVVGTILGVGALGALAVGAAKATAGFVRGVQAVHDLNMSGLDLVRDLTFFL